MLVVVDECCLMSLALFFMVLLSMCVVCVLVWLFEVGRCLFVGDCCWSFVDCCLLFLFCSIALLVDWCYVLLVVVVYGLVFRV